MPDSQLVAQGDTTGPRIILITGGANGIGAAMVRHFTTIGHRVAVADIDLESGRELAKATGCLLISADASVFADNQTAVHETVEHFGDLDTVCLNVGISVERMFGKNFDPVQYRRGMQVNVDSAVYGLNAVLPHLQARGGGTILVTSSVAGIVPGIGPYYTAAKHALIGLSRSFARILKKDNITVNAICPGFVDTQLLSHRRGNLVAQGMAIADTEHIAAAAATILDSPDTGQAWIVQANQPARLVDFPKVSMAMAADQMDPTPDYQ